MPRTKPRLIEKYGADLLAHPPLLTPERFEQKIAQRDALDQNFARISAEFVSGVCRRPGLSPELRMLVQIGQFAVSKSHGHLEDVLRAAIAAGVPLRKAAESVFLTHVYAGETVVEPALQILTRVAGELGVLDDLREGQVPLDGHPRDLEAERAKWAAELTGDRRLPDLIKKFGWRGVSTGYRYRGTHHLDSLESHTKQDLAFGQLWERFVYQGMYSRWVLDDKTRLLCTTGDCLALGAAAAESARDHMEEALHFGNSPREMLELVLMTGAFFGFPGLSIARATLFKILQEQGRLGEIAAGAPA